MNFQRSNTKISLLEDYYNHFNEDHRLQTRHGNVEFITNIKYIEEVLHGDKDKTILDIGAGTGAYSVYFDKQGYKVTAVELVPHNIDVFKAKGSNVDIHQGNALDLSFLPDDSFDVTLVFGPIYHLMNKEDKVRALLEAKRVTKPNGIILTSYYMNEYAVISYAFMKKHILESKGDLTEDFHVINKPDDLYSMVRLEDINEYNELAGLNRVKIIASDGPSDYLRVFINALSEEEYQEFIAYHLATCERPELLGASSHVLDITKKK
ncbi:MAG: class I SAM-dependent methyltransferase [Bacilli bacterium]|nr:class I SAM-dependent methyltransferase [Bacilli bacterium]